MTLKRLAVAGAVALASVSSFAQVEVASVGFSCSGPQVCDGSFASSGPYTGVLDFDVGLVLTGLNFLSKVNINGTDYAASGKSFTKLGTIDFVDGVPFTVTVYGGTTSTTKLFNYGGSYTLATPIPEPETYALMLAGLGAIGFMARRRKA